MKSQFAANNFTLVSNIDPEPGSGIKYSGCWGWYDSINNKEYAIAGSKTGTYFIDITNPSTPTVSAFYPATASNGNWREMKSYKNYCYVVNDNGAGTTGLQIFDMSTLPTTVTLVSQNMNLFRKGHAAWIDGDKLYVSGITYSNNTTSSLNVYSLATPTAPVLLRELKQDYSFITYVHDAFARNDTVFASAAYQGLYVFKFDTNSNTFLQIGSLTSYPGSGYNHSTALTPDGKTLVMLDEIPASLPIKVLDVTNISNIQVLATANQFTASTPHNPWIVNNQYCFISSYQDGTQLWDISNPSAPVLAGYFDTYPAGGGNNNNWSGSAYNGQWGLYPYYPSKSIFALDRQNGVFIMNTHLFANPEINIEGNSNQIQNNSTTTSTTNSTFFGNVVMPGSVTHTFAISNTGIGDLVVSNMTINGPANFTIVSPAAPFTVSPSASQTLAIKFEPSTAGTKSGTVVLSNNDLDEGAYNFVVEGFAISTVALDELEDNNQLMIYPNPANSEINVLTSHINDINSIEIFNINGELIDLKKSHIEEKEIIKISTNELANGIYFISIKSNDFKESRTKRFVINH
ncbi:MAG: choice-of-anchor B family protein [Bacteroidia bacterium]